MNYTQPELLLLIVFAKGVKLLHALLVVVYRF